MLAGMTAAPPNLLVLFPDQWRFDWLGCLGVPVRTPNLDALAARGTLFTQCRSNSPLCAPSRSCLSSGLRYRACGVPDNHHNLDPALPNCWQALRAAGYRVATCGKDDIHKGDPAWHPSGWMPQLGRLGFTEARAHAGKHDAGNKLKRGTPCLYGDLLTRAGRAQDYLDDLVQRAASVRGQGRHDPSPHRLPRELYTDDVCGQQALRLLDGLPVGTPWSLWVNFPGPHEPFDPPADLAAAWAGATLPAPVAPGTDASDHAAVRRSYAAMMQGIDEWCGRILAALEARGELERTVVVFSSDHGEMLGDRGLWHKSVAYEPSVHVPLIVTGPGVAAGRRSAALVELCDLAPTLAEAGGAVCAPTWHGRSLWGALRGATDRHRPHQVMELCEPKRGCAWEAVTDGRLKLVRHGDGRREVYDLVADPHELRDLAAAPPAGLAALEAAFDADAQR